MGTIGVKVLLIQRNRWRAMPSFTVDLRWNQGEFAQAQANPQLSEKMSPRQHSVAATRKSPNYVEWTSRRKVGLSRCGTTDSAKRGTRRRPNERISVENHQRLCERTDACLIIRRGKIVWIPTVTACRWWQCPHRQSPEYWLGCWSDRRQDKSIDEPVRVHFLSGARERGKVTGICWRWLPDQNVRWWCRLCQWQNAIKFRPPLETNGRITATRRNRVIAHF